MENYTKGESRTVYDPPRLSIDGAVEMKVTNGSKIRNVMGFAMSSMADNSVRHMTWNGTGNAINKTISCVEIMKRKIKGLHQITQIGYLRVEDFWEPKIEGLDRGVRWECEVDTKNCCKPNEVHKMNYINYTLFTIILLKVNTNIPAISILLSKDPLDTSNPSYQAPGATDVAWAGPSTSRKRPTVSKKRQDAVKDVKTSASRPRRFRDKGDNKKQTSKKTKGENPSAQTKS